MSCSPASGPGGFEARVLDERIPLRHGVIGQETQGPGGFFMALRSIQVMQGVIAEMERLCPDARRSSTTPTRSTSSSEAVTHHRRIRTVSLCEGPIKFPAGVARRRRARSRAAATRRWSGSTTPAGRVRPRVRRRGHGPAHRAACGATAARRSVRRPRALTHAAAAATMGSLPADVFPILLLQGRGAGRAARQADHARARTSWRRSPDYWRALPRAGAPIEPAARPGRSRGGIHELELAIDVIDAVFNDRARWPVNVPEPRRRCPGSRTIWSWRCPAMSARRARAARCAATAAPGARADRGAGRVPGAGGRGRLDRRTRREAIQALASNPLVLSLPQAEAIYDEMAAALTRGTCLSGCCDDDAHAARRRRVDRRPRGRRPGGALAGRRRRAGRRPRAGPGRRSASTPSWAAGGRPARSTRHG